MTDVRYRPRRPARRRGRTLLKVAACIVVLAAVLAVGIALGEALHDGPQAGVTQTYVRTLTPLPQKPPAKP